MIRICSSLQTSKKYHRLVKFKLFVQANSTHCKTQNRRRIKAAVDKNLDTKY